MPDLTMPYLLLAEDDPDLRELLARAFRWAGLQVVECAHGMELLERLEGHINGDPPDGLSAVVTDIRMPGVTGLSILEGLRGLDSCVNVPVFLITAFGSPEVHERAARLGAVRTFDKPFDIRELVGEVARIVGEGRA